jgi:hypothetical protein
MKKTLSAGLLTAALVLAIIAVPRHSASRAIPAKTCSCSAPDGSCSVTITCLGGCDYWCDNNDDCSAECSGFYGTLALETNIEIVDGSYSQLTAKLAEISGRDISFSSARGEDPKSQVISTLGFKKAPLWNALALLSDRGTVRIAGKDFESLRRLRKALLAGKRVNFGVKDTPVNTFVTDLAGLTGLPLRIVKGSPMALANVELREATLEEIIKRVGEETGTSIVESDTDPARP